MKAKHFSGSGRRILAMAVNELEGQCAHAGEVYQLLRYGRRPRVRPSLAGALQVRSVKWENPSTATWGRRKIRAS